MHVLNILYRLNLILFYTFTHDLFIKNKFNK